MFPAVKVSPLSSLLMTTLLFPVLVSVPEVVVRVIAVVVALGIVVAVLVGGSCWRVLRGAAAGEVL